MSLPTLAGSKFLPQALLSKANAVNQIVSKADPITITTSNSVGPVMAGVFLAAPSSVIKRATTGDTIIGWVNGPPTGSTGCPLQAMYLPTSTAGQATVLDMTYGPIFTLIDNTSVEASTLYGQAAAATVDINAGLVYCDMVNGTDVTDTASPGTATPAPIGSVLAKSDTYNTTQGALQFRVLGLNKDPGNIAAPYKYDVQCVKFA